MLFTLLNFLLLNCLFLAGYAKVELTLNGADYIVYSSEEMQEYKKNCITNLRPLGPNYQMQRAILTITTNDADYIPKVPHAGEIFTDATIPYQLMHNGTKIILNSYYDCSWITDVIHALRGHHEPQEEKCFYEILKHIPEGATMIELGSYWAYYSLWFSSQINDAKNYLIEPDPYRLEIGRRNFELNNKTGNFTRGYIGTISDTEPDISGTGPISLNEFITQNSIEHIHILHSDIQGAESEMLKSLGKDFDKIDYFFISTHGSRVHQACLETLREHECIIIAENPDSEKTGCDGLIVAKKKGIGGPNYIDIQK